MPGLDLDAIQDKKERRGSGTTWRPKEGVNPIRVLPPTREYFDDFIDYFALTFHIHYFRQQGYDTEVTRCLRDKHEYCPACEMAQKFRDSDDPALKETAGDIKRVERHAMNILDLEDPESGIQPYHCGYTVHNEILEYIASPRWGDIIDPRDGHDIDLKLTPASKSRSGYNSYSVQPNPDRTTVVSALPENWMDELDKLKYSLPEYKESSEIETILARLNFPVEVADDDGPEPQGGGGGVQLGGGSSPSQGGGSSQPVSEPANTTGPATSAEDGDDGGGASTPVSQPVSQPVGDTEEGDSDSESG